MPSRRSFDTAKQLGKFDVEGTSESRQGTKAGFFPPKFQIGNEVLIQASLLREVELTPSTCLA